MSFFSRFCIVGTDSLHLFLSSRVSIESVTTQISDECSMIVNFQIRKIFSIILAVVHIKIANAFHNDFHVV
jgi:hypothetical protein